MAIWRSSSALAAIIALAAALPGTGSAQSLESAGSVGPVVSALGLIPVPTTELVGQLDIAGGGSILVGRDQDIVGTPIDFERIRRPVLAGVRTPQAGPPLPLVAAMPSRFPLDFATMTSRFGQRQHPVLGTHRMHSGVDLAAPVGSPIYATASGYVIAAAWNGGYGLSVVIEHGGGLQTRYGHMSRLAVMRGQYVVTGTLIGYVGSTGLSTGPHLHYEIRVNGIAVNPVQGLR